VVSGRAAAKAIFCALALVLSTAAAVAAAKSEPPKPLEPIRELKPQDPDGGEAGYFDDVFGLDADGKRLAAIRTDGASFARLEVFDLATGAREQVADLPEKTLVPVRIELLAPGKGLVLVARLQADDEAPVFAYRIGGDGKTAARIGPATTFGWPSAHPAEAHGKSGDKTHGKRLLVAFDRKLGAHGAEATYTVAPFDLDSFAPASKPRSYRTDVAGALAAPPVVMIGFFDGYTRILGERPGAYDKGSDVRTPPRIATLDAVSGKLVSETEIGDVVGWAVTSQLRREHPGRSLFVELNQDGSGVDVVDAMGKKAPVTPVVPFNLYDPKNIQIEEDPSPTTATFALAVDPANPDAIKRHKLDLPMLDVYSAESGGGDSTVKWRGRVFTPRPVTWRARNGRLAVLKRFKSFSRGGDALQIFDLR
jgi:hypothetical protein